MKDITKQDLLKVSNIIRGNSSRYSFSKESKSKNKLYLLMEEKEEFSKFKSDLIMAFKILNKLPVLEPLGDEDRNVVIDDTLKTFAIRSGLWKGKMESVPVNSIIFKARFISNIIITIDENIVDIVSHQLEKKGTKHEIPETLSLLKQIRSCIADFVIAFVYNKNYHHTLSKIHELIIVSNTSHGMSLKRLDNIRIMVEKQLDKLDDSLNGGIFVPKVEDYIIMHNLLLTAFSAVLGLDVKKTFMVSEEYTFNNKEGTKELIGMLGETIWKRRNVLCVNELVAYQWFINSLPDIKYKFKDINSHEYLRIGCRALSYIYFITDSKNLKKLIKRLIY